jgi:hypothetical protein
MAAIAQPDQQALEVGGLARARIAEEHDATPAADTVGVAEGAGEVDLALEVTVPQVALGIPGVRERRRTVCAEIGHRPQRHVEVLEADRHAQARLEPDEPDATVQFARAPPVLVDLA